MKSGRPTGILYASVRLTTCQISRRSLPLEKANTADVTSELSYEDPGVDPQHDLHCPPLPCRGVCDLAALFPLLSVPQADVTGRQPGPDSVDARHMLSEAAMRGREAPAPDTRLPTRARPSGLRAQQEAALDHHALAWLHAV